MSKILFTEEDIKKLKKNKNVAKASEKSITYTFEFKRLFIYEYIAGKLPRKYFHWKWIWYSSDCNQRVEQSADRWKKLTIKVVL